MARPPAQQFTDLLVWQKAHAFVLSVYEQSRNFPREELYGLTRQLRRAAVSIAANIAGGFRKRSAADKSRFMNMAEGSLDECRYYVLLANDLNYGIEREQLMGRLDEIARLLHAYTKTLRGD